MPNDTDHLYRYARRLASDPEPGCWFGFVIRAIPSAPKTIDGVTIQAPDHYLTAAWQPTAGLLSRLPDVVAIGSPTATRALAELFVHLPKDARLHLVERDVVDAALLAGIVALPGTHLQPHQRGDVYKIAEQERARARAAIAGHFFERA